MTWRQDAACLGHDPELWHPSKKGEVRPEAFRICRDCPVRTDCLDDALDLDQSDDYGIWGGTTHRNRQRIRVGKLDRAGAMAAGDRLADQCTAEEIAADPRPTARARQAWHDRMAAEAAERQERLAGGDEVTTCGVTVTVDRAGIRGEVETALTHVRPLPPPDVLIDPRVVAGRLALPPQLAATAR